MNGDGWIALVWMAPIYTAVLLPAIVIVHMATRCRPTLLQVGTWLVMPLLVWWCCTMWSHRWLALLNVLVEPPVLGLAAVSLYLWKELAKRGELSRREGVALILLLGCAATIGWFAPSLGESP